MSDKDLPEKESDGVSGLPPGLPPGFDTQLGESTIPSVGPNPVVKKQKTTYRIPKIEGYEVHSKLGQGGMGSVFLATDNKLGRKVAIKIISQSFRDLTEVIQRFESEIQTLATLQHPHIAQLYSAGTHQELPYFVMEYVEGPTLEEVAQDPLSPREVAEIGLKLCDAMTYCHQKNVLHRDLKPANILMQMAETPKIADFGLAKALGSDTSSTRTGEILGTPNYMAPEQASGLVKNLTPATDIYSLGGILYRLLTGRPPFVASEPFQVVTQVLADDPISPRKLVKEIPVDIETICLKCLQKLPEKRYSSAQTLGEELQRFLDGKPILARPAGYVEKTWKWVKRNPVPALLSSGLVILTIGILVAQSWHSAILAQQLDRTRRLADHGSELSQWLINQHAADLNNISGTSVARHDLVNQVQQYLDLSFADMPPDAKYTWRLGKSYSQLASIAGGSDLNNLGFAEQAELNYQKALELYDQAIAQGGDASGIERLRVECFLDLAQVYQNLQKHELHDEYRQLAATKLAELPQKQLDVKMLKTRLLFQEIADYRIDNKYDKALETLATIEELLATMPDQDTRWTDEITNSKILLAIIRGECHEYLGALDKSQSSYEAAEKITRELVEQRPDNALAKREHASSLTKLGDILIVREQAEKALSYFQRSRQILKQLSVRDPASVELAIELAAIHDRVYRANRYLNRLDQADDAIGAAIQLIESLERQNKASLSTRRALAIYLTSQAEICIVKGESDNANEFLQRHRKLCQRILESEPDSVLELNQLAENHYMQAVQMVPRLEREDFDPSKGRENQAYKDIRQEFQKCLEMFERIEKVGALNYHQIEFRKKVELTQQVIEDSMDQLLDSAGGGDKH